MGDDAPPALPSHVTVVYKDAIDYIVFLKKQQWAVTNYSVAIYAGVFALTSSYGADLTSTERHALSLAVLLTLGYCFYFLVKAQQGMTKFRRRLAWINARYFTVEERTGLALTTCPKTAFYDFDFFLLLFLVSVLAATLAHYFMWR